MSRRPVILLTTFQTGVTEGRGLGVAGYSYDILAQQFLPLFKQWGQVIPVADPKQNLEAAAETARGQNLNPIHVALFPLERVTFSESMPNVVIPAWEYPDIPQEAFFGNQQCNWVASSRRCAVIAVAGRFTEQAFRGAGVKSNVRIVPAPVSNDYFNLSRRMPDSGTHIDCSTFEFPQQQDGDASLSGRNQKRTVARRTFKLMDFGIRSVYRTCVRPLMPRRIERVATAAIHASHLAWKRSALPPRGQKSNGGLDLDGVVYTSVFNPGDPRKNWEDLLSGFLHALGDCEDATLVIKLATSEGLHIESILSGYRAMRIAHRCRLVFIDEYLSDQQMRSLAEASTYYITTTHAEGYCLPLMNYLAAGRPAISASHSAIADYFNDDMGFVIESNPAPTSFLFDTTGRRNTTWHRLDWPSLVEQIQKSYNVAKFDRSTYEAKSNGARENMRQRCDGENVWPHLRDALETALRSSDLAHSADFPTSCVA